MNENKTNINWYPGHMLKTKKQMIEDLKLIDVVIEILDARIPLSSQNPDIQKPPRCRSACLYKQKSNPLLRSCLSEADSPRPLQTCSPRAGRCRGQPRWK